MSEKSLFWKIKHSFAVLIEPLRRPGRFSLCHYSQEGARERLNSASGGRVLDIGAGAFRVAPHVIAVDFMAQKGVDVVAHASTLPFQTGTIDGIWMGGLLEHIPEPEFLLNESNRVLKKGGWLYCEVPFLYGEHNAPGDYRRWTRQGLRQTFKDWDVEWVQDVSGAFSALAYQLRSCLSILTSFGSDFLYKIFFDTIWAYFVWPIKLLDRCLSGHPRAKELAAGYGIMVKKR